MLFYPYAYNAEWWHKISNVISLVPVTLSRTFKCAHGRNKNERAPMFQRKHRNPIWLTLLIMAGTCLYCCRILLLIILADWGDGIKEKTNIEVSFSCVGVLWFAYPALHHLWYAGIWYQVQVMSTVVHGNVIYGFLLWNSLKLVMKKKNNCEGHGEWVVFSFSFLR